MKNLKTPQCPYCGKKIGFFAAWTLRREGEYRCRGCEGVSNIVLSRRVFLFAGVCVAISAAFVGIGGFLLQTVNLPVVLGTVLPFFAFYAFVPFFLELKRPVLHRKKAPRGMHSMAGGTLPPPAYAGTADAATRVMERPVVPAPNAGAGMADAATRVMERLVPPAPNAGMADAAPTVQLEIGAPIAPLGAVAALTEEIARETEPVFYERRMAAKQEGQYYAYRRPLKRHLPGQAP